MLLYYIRHADPIYDPDSLTPLGIRQAEALAHRLAAHGIDRIYSSSSKRAQDTARPTAEIVKKDVTVLDWAHEETFWEEASVKQPEGGTRWFMHTIKYRNLMNSDEIRDLGKSWFDHPEFKDTTLPDGIKRIQREADAFLLSLGYEHDRDKNCYIPVRPNDDRVAFFAHQSFGIAFLSAILDIPYPMFCTHFDINHSGMTVVEFGDKGFDYNIRNDVVIPQMITLSNDSHLWREGLPTRQVNGTFI